MWSKLQDMHRVEESYLLKRQQLPPTPNLLSSFVNVTLSRLLHN